MKIIKILDTWHEFNRPQIHGYDLNVIACTRKTTKEKNLITKIVSGGDEKIIRKFEAPYSLIKFSKELSKVDLVFSEEHEKS